MIDFVGFAKIAGGVAVSSALIYAAGRELPRLREQATRTRAAVRIVVCVSTLAMLAAGAWFFGKLNGLWAPSTESLGPSAIPGALVLTVIVSAPAYMIGREIFRVADPALRKKALVQLAAVAVAGFLLFAVLDGMRDVPEQAKIDFTMIKMDEVAKGLAAFKAAKGRFPSAEEAQLVKDAWGEELRYEIEGEGFVLRSDGTDQKAGTGDDLFFGRKPPDLP